MSEPDLVAGGIARQADLLHAGEVSPRELVTACLERIEERNPSLRAFRAVYAERALKEAAAAEAELRRGGDDGERPLLGVPIAIKDDTDVAGDVTTFGTDAHGGPAAADADVVRRLRAAGGIVIGKTRVPELVMWPFTETATWGVTRNPWNRDRTPGGSSGGSGAAVAAGMVGGALGSDGAGSIRIPSSCCGVFGIKPQRGRISIAPHDDREGGWHGLAVYGPMTPTVRDAALFLDATAVTPPPRTFSEAAARAPGRLRIALSLRMPPSAATVMARLDPEVRRATDEVGSMLRALGHEVVERDPDYGMVANHTIVRYLRGIADDVRRLPRPGRLERRSRRMAALGRLLPEGVLARERARERTHAARIGALFEECDVLLTPALTKPPIEIGQFEGRGALWTLLGSAGFVAHLPVWNATGQPAAAVPAGLTSDGLPIGVQLVGRPADEATLLSLSAQIEAERPWAQRLPASDSRSR